MFTHSSQTTTCSASKSLQQCIEEKIHSVTSELVHQLLALPDVTCVELIGHLRVIINSCFTFTILPNPSGLMKKQNLSKFCADLPGKEQRTSSEQDVVLHEMKSDGRAKSEAHVSEKGLNNDSTAEKDAAEYIMETGINKDSIESEARKHVQKTGVGVDFAVREATEHVLKTGFAKDSIESEARKPILETGVGAGFAEREATKRVLQAGFGKDSIESEARKHVLETSVSADSVESILTQCATLAETSLGKSTLESEATELVSGANLVKDFTESEATECVLKTGLGKDSAEESSDNMTGTNTTDLKRKPHYQVLSAELAREADKQTSHRDHSSQRHGRKRCKSGSPDTKTSSIQDEAHISGATDFHGSASQGTVQQPGLLQKASTANHKTGRCVPARGRPARKRVLHQRKWGDSRQEEAFTDCLVQPKHNIEPGSGQDGGIKPEDQDKSAEVTEKESQSASAAVKQEHRRLESTGEAEKNLKELQCSVCNKKYPAEKHSAFEQHVMKHAHRVQCETCGKWLSCIDSLKHHQRGLHGTQKPYRCEECGMSFNFHHSFKLHRFKHSGARPHACPHCPKSYLTSNHLKAHLIAAHSAAKEHPVRYQCEICGHSFASTGSLKNHRFRHSDVKPYHCDICSKGFNSKSALKVHGKSVHVTERKFECDICHKFFKSEHIRNMHKRRHSAGQTAQFICDVCGRQFQFQSSLQAHAGVHKDAFPYTCQICGKGFKLLPSLHSHRYTHTLERPFQCSLCPKTFKSKSTRTAHERRHNATKSFACQTCSARFPDKGALDKHTRTIHTPTRMFQCTICGKTGARMDNMRTRTKSHRRDWSVEQINACIRQISQ